MTTTRLDPIVVDLERDQDVILRVDGQVVAVLVADAYNAIHPTSAPSWCARPLLHVDERGWALNNRTAAISSGSAVYVSQDAVDDLDWIMGRMEEVR